MRKIAKFIVHSLLYFNVLAVAIISVYGIADPIDIRCTDKGDLCPMDRTCPFKCQFTCCKKKENNFLVSGSIIYSSESSICRSALHDLRISLHNKNDREVKIQRFQLQNCSLESSVKHGFSSSSYQNETCSVFKFVSPHIKEDILDVVSMHSNYLFGPNENHTQKCATASNAMNQKVGFGLYSEWISCNENKEAEGIEVEGVMYHENVWSGKHFSSGFQCIPTRTDFSIVTSIAFRKDASFLPNRLTIVANKHETVTLTMNEVQEMDFETVWRKDDKILHHDNRIRTKLSLYNISESVSGIYSLTYRNSSIEESGFVQLIVRACPAGKFGDDCSLACPVCLHGGICHDITGECVCAPGFNGPFCEKACNPGHVGKTCSIKCTGEFSEYEWCKGLLICLPNPYGCSCASGFAGLQCDNACSHDFYGAGCLQRHRHIHRIHETCDKYSDFCECQKGWHGTYCNESCPVLKDPPSLYNVTERSIALSFNRWSNSTDIGSGKPYSYEVVYKEIDDDIWTFGPNVPVKDGMELYEVRIDNLKAGTQYEVGVIVVDESGNKQEIGINTMTAETDCDTPSMPPSKVQLSSANQHIYVHWEEPPRESWNCWNINISVSASEISTNQTAECIRNGNFSCSFYTDPLDTWVVQVCASTDEWKQNCTNHEKITSGPAHSSPVEMEIIKKETSVHLSWTPPILSRKLKYYVINYEDVDSKTFHSVTVQPHDSQCKGTKGIYNCYSVQNLKSGHTYAFQIIAFLKNANEGNLIKSFIVRLQKYPDVIPIILGISMPVVFLLCITIAFIFWHRRRKIKSSLTVKFIPYKNESEYASCNDALDELEIIETESMCEEISNAIPLDELLNYVKQSLQNVRIRKEFMSVPTGQIYPSNIAKLGENKPKNRYGNILPYDHSRVILDTMNCDPFSNYIHASYIHGYSRVKNYIATQGPLSNTVNDFWRMVWNENACKILMITNFVENGKYKCEKYWNETTSTYGNIEVSLKNTESYADFTIRTFNISKDQITREIKQFHFTTWPDHGAPSNATPFICYLNKTRSYKTDTEAPIIVHCSAGIGRTGAAILLDSMVDMGLQEKKVDLVNQLCSMRKQRMNIVENYDQYVFVYYALAEILCFESTCVKRSDFKTEIERLKDTDKATGIRNIEKQFKALESLNIELMFKDVQGAYQQENQSKNRSMYILPPDRGRPSMSRNSSAYINAVFVDSFTRKHAFIATQYPLPDTVSDFWSMIYQQKSKIVVVLQDIDYSIEETPHFWEPMNIQTFGEFEISCESVSTEDELTVANITLSITEENSEEPIPVNILTLKNWSASSSIPEKISTMLSALLKVHSLNSESKTIITAVCPDGATACGLFFATLYICDQIRAEDVVDIFHAVKCIRTNRSQFILNLAQYEFLFETILSYLEAYEA